MDNETLERLKRDMEANRFSEAALTVFSLSEGLDLLAEIKRLNELVELLQEQNMRLQEEIAQIGVSLEAEKEADREAERQELWQPGDEP